MPPLAIPTSGAHVRRVMLAATFATAASLATFTTVDAAPKSPAVTGAMSPADAVLGWTMSADFPDLSSVAETHSALAFPNRCWLVGPLPCP